MRRQYLIELVVLLLIMLLLYASFNKIFSFSFFLKDLRRSPLLQHFASPLSILIPLSEILISVLLIIPRTRRIGLAGATVIMFLFTGYVVYVLTGVEHRPCSCGGIIRELTWKQHLVFNIAFLFLSFFGLIYSREKKYPMDT